MMAIERVKVSLTDEPIDEWPGRRSVVAVYPEA
jgi:hypothetical protein